MSDRDEKRNIVDLNEKYNTVKENIVNILIQYDEHVRYSHENLIQYAEYMAKGTPMQLREPEPNEPMKYYRYMTSPIFATTVEALTGYIMANTKDP